MWGAGFVPMYIYSFKLGTVAFHLVVELFREETVLPVETPWFSLRSVETQSI